MNEQKKRIISFSPPDITETEINEVVEALKSGWITTGPKTKELENKIADWCHTKKAVCLNSNSACAEITLRVLGIGPGDEVIVPAYTYTATASVVDHVGAKIVMVDCEKNKFTMDYNELEKAITPKTKAIIPVDLFGIPCDYNRIYDIVEKKKSMFQPSENKIQQSLNRIIVVADAAHSFGATYENKPIGSIADFTNFSFHAVKNFTTAEGGAVTWKKISGVDDEELYYQYMLLSLHGQSKDALAKNKLGAWEYDILGTWYKCNMTDIHAAIGLGQMKRYPDLLNRRQEIIQKYNEGLSSMNIKFVNHKGIEYQGSGHLYVIQLLGKEKYRNKFIKKMAENGIATNVHYKPLPLLTAYINLGFDIKNYPNAYQQYINEVTLPLHTSLCDTDIQYILGNIKNIYTNLEK